MDPGKDMLIDDVLGGIDKSKSVKVVISVTRAPISESIGLPIALAVSGVMTPAATSCNVVCALTLNASTLRGPRATRCCSTSCQRSPFGRSP